MKLLLLIALTACGRIDFASAPLDAAVGVCPRNYIEVPGNVALGTGAFCVMQFEAKAWRDDNSDGVVETGELLAEGCDAACTPGGEVATHLPVSEPSAAPWRAVSQRDAATLCAALGTGFDLMSNREWMTIARDLELVAESWYGGAPGAGRMPEGNTDTRTSFYAAVSDVDDPYSDTGNTASDPPGSGWEQRRALPLTTGAVIWDLAGNVQEWVDWTLGPPLDAPPACPGGELPALSCPGLAYDDFNSSTGTYDTTHGVGRVIGGSGTAARRGGQTSDLTLMIAGIYALNMNRDADQTFPGTGFRCVRR